MRVLLRIAYDGTAYAGWQKQPGQPTIQGSVEDALRSLFPQAENWDLIGGSRTDAGVHSYGNPAVFDIDTRMAPERIAPALNVRLPEDIRVISSIAVPEEFHPHRVLSRKTYEYRIANVRILTPVERRYRYGVHVPMDIGRMQEAGSILTGTHDFTSFSSVHAQVQSRIRTIYDLEVSSDEIRRPGTDPVPMAALQKEQEIRIRVTGNGFLYNMVRIIAGTLIEAGRGRIEPAQMKNILEGKDRSLAGPTAPPQGLFLIGTEFDQIV